MLPDWLSRGTPPYGTVEYNTCNDPDLDAERAWLSSNVRCFLENTLLHGRGEARPEQCRVATYWWLVMLETVIRHKTGAGLEQVGSPETATACLQILGDAATVGYTSEAPQLFRSKRYPYQWCGVLAIPPIV